MSATERSYATIGGVPLQYLRTSPAPTTYRARSTAAFEDKLDAFSAELARAVPPWYGDLVSIATAGAYVNTPQYHGLGRAFDLDQVRWQRRVCSPLRGRHRSSATYQRRRYIGVDAIARRHFKYVLDGWYNAAHGDHLHLDDGGGALVFNRAYRSDTVCIQAAANEMMGAGLVVDGIYGPNTRRAFRRLKDRLNIPHRVSHDAAVYGRFLSRLAHKALRNRAI